MREKGKVVPQGIQESIIDSALLATPPIFPLTTSLLEVNDQEVLHAILYAHKEYLSKPYLGPFKNPNVPSEGRIPPNEGPNRYNHGLAHTTRTMVCTEVMLEEARKAQFRGEQLGTTKNGRTLADVTQEELKKILIAQVFFVVGRDDERSGYDASLDRNFYHEYHEKSEDAFRKYVEENGLIGSVFSDQLEVDAYAAIIRDQIPGWDNTPAHLFINLAHLVDLMRVKVPQEAILEYTFDTLRRFLGSQGAEAVLSTHRTLFLATGAVVPLFNPEARDDPSNGGPYESPFNNKKYIIKNNTTPNALNEMQLRASTYRLKNNERFLTIKEYYALPEVQQKFPGAKTYLEPTHYMVPTPFARMCEQNTEQCLAALNDARNDSKVKNVKAAVQSPSANTRRKASADEIAAACIIQQILANPDVIQDDHILLSEQRLDEQFFRALLANCDMAVVGSLLNNTDIENVDNLMAHQQDTYFHSTNTSALPVNLGLKWNALRRNGLITQDIIYLMQNDEWYFSRVNAIAQNRDSGSSFKEILITALMTPITSKALVDTQGRVSSPKKLYRGLHLSSDIQKKWINEANSIIANTGVLFFTDCTTETLINIRLSELVSNTHKTNTSTSASIDVPREIWGCRTILELEDPDGLLKVNKVGGHTGDSEQEYNFYPPEDVLLIPTRVIPDQHYPQGFIISCVAVKSPDFAVQHESGFVEDTLVKINIEQLREVKRYVEQLNEEIREEGIFAIVGLKESIQLSPTDHLDAEYKDYMQNEIQSTLDLCFNALYEGKTLDLAKALKAIPDNERWINFNTEDAIQAKKEMDILKQLIESKLLLQNQVFLPLTVCESALTEKNISHALQALKDLPSDSEIGKITLANKNFREQIQYFRQDLTKTYTQLGDAVNVSLITNLEKVRIRYETIIKNVTSQISVLENAVMADSNSIKNDIIKLDTLHRKIEFLRNEKERMYEVSETIDFADVQELEEKLELIKATLYEAYTSLVREQRVVLEENQSNDTDDQVPLELVTESPTQLPKKLNNNNKFFQVPVNERDEYTNAVAAVINNDELMMGSDNAIPKFILDIRNIIRNINDSNENTITEAILSIQKIILNSLENNLSDNNQDIINAFTQINSPTFKQVRLKLEENYSMRRVMDSTITPGNLNRI